MILLFYPQIQNFYEYSVPLNSFVLESLNENSTPDTFERIKHQEGSMCFTTSNNEYCFSAPRGGGDFKFSHPVGSNGITGEMHFEPAHNATGYWTMRSIEPMPDDVAVITFSDNSDHYPDETLARWHITDTFEFAKTVKKYDTFVAYCADNGKYIEIMQYMGVFTIQGNDYVTTWHVGATSEIRIACKYPEIIQNSFGHDFGI